eukprot:CAMPEP_0115156726 /NCGR_PEP_ID=MMETSP0227-20121206/68619_1 /TAXON_ID=89957 /ORGANISM="Polarella glacialis, Strain CCMP 1383" /LENGTH=47 /DNA_ID= /DNA_START= /DNA_END= /DNA_ORIENTATION=
MSTGWMQLVAIMPDTLPVTNGLAAFQASMAANHKMLERMIVNGFVTP